MSTRDARNDGAQTKFFSLPRNSEDWETPEEKDAYDQGYKDAYTRGQLAAITQH